MWFGVASQLPRWHAPPAERCLYPPLPLLKEKRRSLGQKSSDLRPSLANRLGPSPIDRRHLSGNRRYGCVDGNGRGSFLVLASFLLSCSSPLLIYSSFPFSPCIHLSIYSASSLHLHSSCFSHFSFSSPPPCLLPPPTHTLLSFYIPSVPLEVVGSYSVQDI